MVALILTLVVEYTLQASLVGAALAWFLALRGKERLRPLGMALLVAAFAVLDLFWIPAVVALDATITIGNEAIAESFGIDGPVPVDALLSFNLFNLPAYVAQAIVAMVTAQLFLRWRSAA